MNDRVALITGGGTGIGAATARLFAEAGAAVCVTGRRQAPLDEVVAAVRKRAAARFPSRETWRSRRTVSGWSTRLHPPSDRLISW